MNINASPWSEASVGFHFRQSRKTKVKGLKIEDLGHSISESLEDEEEL